MIASLRHYQQNGELMTQMPATYTQQPSCWTPAACAVVPERRTGVACTGDFISILLFKNGRRLVAPTW